MLKDSREGRPEEPGGRGLNKGSNLESISKTFVAGYFSANAVLSLVAAPDSLVDSLTSLRLLLLGPPRL